MQARAFRRPAAALLAVAFAVLPATGAQAADSARTSGTGGSGSTTSHPSDPLVWGKLLYEEGCASCHGLQGQGIAPSPAIKDSGAAAVDFEVSTGRMPLGTIANQALRRAHSLYTAEETQAMAQYVATLGNGPAIPTQQVQGWENADMALGGQVFRTNCAQCHSFSGQGGALTWGKQAPNLMKATPTQIYEAMLVGPNNMPKFSDQTLPPAEKRAVIKYIEFLRQPDNPGGLDLGRLGPVSEGLFGWFGGFGILVAIAIWIGVKAK